EATELLAPVAESTVIAAHCHLPMDVYVGRHHLFNTGTVGNPLDGFMGATYLLLEGDWDGWTGVFRRVPADFSACVREFERQGFVEQVGQVGRLIVEEFRTCRMRLAPFKVWLSERLGGQTVPDREVEAGWVEAFLALPDSAIEAYMPPEYRRAHLPRL
nr:hypothetical protein [Anaerolineae bacterium]